MSSLLSVSEDRLLLEKHAKALGFSQIRVAEAGVPPDAERLGAWLEAGHAGEMDFQIGRAHV